jgi:tRNA A-37 threonylcarbamoyl transferase component Bud32
MKVVINPSYVGRADVRAFFDHLEEHFSQEGEELFHGRNQIRQFVVDEHDAVLKRVVVKRFRRPSFFQSVAYSFFRSNKARRAYANATTLLERGFSTPKNVGYAEEWQGGLLKCCYYVTGFDDGLPIRRRLIEPADFDRDMASDFAIFAASLHRRGILHGDLNSTNVLYHDAEEGHFTFSVIDINRMRVGRSAADFSQEELFENMTRFTGRMDLFEYVMRIYIGAMGWDVARCLPEAIHIKERHDARWRRRKAFFKRLKKVF